MLVEGLGDTGRDGASVASQEGVGVKVTGQGWFGAEGSGPEIGAEGTRLEGGDAESSGVEVGEVDGAEYGVDLAGLAVKAGWGVCRFISTLIATLEYKVEKEFKTLICCFAVQPDSRLHLSVEVSARLDWGFQGEDGLSPIDYRHACHSPWAALTSPATVVATSWGVGMCKRFRLQSSQQDPHKFQFLQRNSPCRFRRTVPARM